MSAASQDTREVKERKEIIIKEKRRKRTTLKTESRSSSPDSKRSRDQKGKQTSKALFYYEENEVEQRDPTRDVDLEQTACDELRRVMNEIRDLKDCGESATVNKKIEALRIHGTLQFVTLKKMNRMGHFRCKKVRERTNEAKQQIDTQHLKLQNLLYEVMHLQKEINKCLEFTSKDEDINLVSVNEFYSEAPPDICKPGTTKKDLHQQTLARLDWELEQRKRLSEKLKEAQKNKDSTMTEIETKKEYLDSLQPKLNSILQATKPVQEHLGMPFDEIREQQATAAYLPRPLYVFYMQASAYKDACDKFISVSIHGDVDVARAMEGSQPEPEEESDSDGEEQDKPTEKRSRRRKSTNEDDKMSERKQKMLKQHPLSVHLDVKCKDGSVLYLVFSYLVALKVVTVSVKLTPGPDTVYSTICAGDLLSPELIMSCLYPDDFGSATPNPSNTFALQRLGMGDFSEYVREVGRPYQWAQWLCGLQFLHLASDKVSKAQATVSASHMEGTIQRLRRRIRARLSLQKQLACLERSNVSVSSEYQHLFPAKNYTRLSHWKRSTYEDFAALPYAQAILNAELAQESDMFFVGTMERGSAKLSLQVVITPDYPNTPSVFALSCLWKRERNNINDESIREMEAEVNIHHDELMKDKSHDQLLTNQLQRLLMCFDVYLETASESSGCHEGPIEFAREKMFPRVCRGPGRSRPYVYHSQLGFFSPR